MKLFCVSCLTFLSVIQLLVEIPNCKLTNCYSCVLIRNRITTQPHNYYFHRK
uniref:Hypotheticial protein n=1 Tax=Schistosoma japonicum TaxID=6182 RepID=C1LHC0_SCHJA|nr:hypotheticial protein [Schistosoma japonicum]